MGLKKKKVTSDKNKKISSKERLSKLPEKRSINLASVGVTSINKKIAVPAIVVIVLAACLLSKVAVVDRMAKVSEAEGNVLELQQQVEACEEAMANQEDISEDYAHYTMEGLTEEECFAVDRVAVLNLIHDQVLPFAEIGGWELSGNILTLQVTSENLKSVNQIVERLEAEDIVSYCTVNTAVSDSTESGNRIILSSDQEETEETETDWDDNVTAEIVIYLS